MIPKGIKRFTAFVDGKSYIGIVTELEPPKLAIKTNEFQSGGMDAPVEIDMGMEKLEGSATFAEYNEDLFAQFGIGNSKDVSMTFRGSARGQGEAHGVIHEMRGMFKEVDSGTWKAGDDSTAKFTIAIKYYKLTINGRDLVEIDIENTVRIINGKDILESERKALGV